MGLEFKWLNQTIKEPVRDQKLSIADNIHINSDIIKHIDPEQLSEKNYLISAQISIRFQQCYSKIRTQC